MADIITILDADTKDVIQGVLDSFLVNNAQGGLGKTCLVVYPPKKVRCDNCVYDAQNNRSSNRPRHGAPVPFAAGSTCPLCNGRGLKEEEVTEEMTLKCNWEAKKFARPVPGIELRVPYSVVETKGFLKDLPKLLKASYIVVNLPLAPFLRQKFRLLGQPGDGGNIIQGRYFTAAWEQFE